MSGETARRAASWAPRQLRRKDLNVSSWVVRCFSGFSYKSVSYSSLSPFVASSLRLSVLSFGILKFHREHLPKQNAQALR